MASPVSITFDVHIHHHPGQAMTTPADILIHIAEGRIEAERGRSLSLSHTLAEVEAMVREIQPTTAPDTEAEAARRDLVYITGGDPKASLAELVSTTGEALDDLRDDRNRLRAEVDRLAGNVHAIVEESKRVAAISESMTAERDALRAVVTKWEATANKMEQAADLFRSTIRILRSEGAELTRERDTLQSEVAALTPGPWLDPATDPPPIGEPVLIDRRQDADGPCSIEVRNNGAHGSWIRGWRRIPAGLLTPPEVTP